MTKKMTKTRSKSADKIASSTADRSGLSEAFKDKREERAGWAD
jgi:hypothetical protein